MADDDMIKYLDVEMFTGLHQLLSGTHVLWRGRGIATWVIMHHNN